jgi:hypothetical protein
MFQGRIYRNKPANPLARQDEFPVLTPRAPQIASWKKQRRRHFSRIIHKARLPQEYPVHDGGFSFYGNPSHCGEGAYTPSVNGAAHFPPVPGKQYRRGSRKDLPPRRFLHARFCIGIYQVYGNTQTACRGFSARAGRAGWTHKKQEPSAAFHRSPRTLPGGLQKGNFHPLGFPGQGTEGQTRPRVFFPGGKTESFSLSVFFPFPTVPISHGSVVTHNTGINFRLRPFHAGKRLPGRLQIFFNVLKVSHIFSP